jgi:hypothetical protein
VCQVRVEGELCEAKLRAVLIRWSACHPARTKCLYGRDLGAGEMCARVNDFANGTSDLKERLTCPEIADERKTVLP